jgi:polyphenol oxidase
MNFIAPVWPAPASIHAFTTTRHSFGKEAPKLAEETQKLMTLFALPSAPIWINQVHATTIVKANPKILNAEADATFTDETRRVCVVLTADCLPILICNKQGTHVAAIHAGWRGLAAGIIERSITALALPPEDLLIWFGPAIGPEKFEVGEDVFNSFTQADPDAIAAFTPHIPGKWLANLYQLAKMRLQKLGVNHIYGGDYCTHSQDDLFFSYRRDKGTPGRMASLIWID